MARSGSSGPARDFDGRVTGAASAIVVSYADPAATRWAVESLMRQTRPPVEVIVVDNHPASPMQAAAAGWDAPVTIVAPDANLGFAGGANAGAQHARGDWLFFLNPDAVADPQCIERMIGAADDRTAIVGAQVLMPGGERVNAGLNPVHISGLSWSGGYLEPRQAGPARDAAAVSGAAFVVRRRAWTELGGLSARFFLYHEDVDLAWRARLAGWRVRYCPDATVVHDYEFDKGVEKWFWLERNRTWTVLTNYAGGTLLLLMPLLLATEAAIVARAAREGWLAQKVRAYVAVARSLRWLWRRRRQVQATRVTPDALILENFAGTMATPAFESGLLDVANPWMERYRRAVLAILRARARHR